MGSCLSRKGLEKKRHGSTPPSSSSPPPPPLPQQQPKAANLTALSPPQPLHEEKISLNQQQFKDEGEAAKREESTPVLVPQTPDKMEEDATEQQPPRRSQKGIKEVGELCNVGGAGAVRTSSCTKEELDAILIQCGRLSRSSSGKGGAISKGTRYSGSKRSYDFDDDNNKEYNKEEEKQEPQTQRGARSAHRRTPSRERESGGGSSQSQLKRSSSAGDEGKRMAGNGRRRASRSPGRRSETPTENSKRPAKMVSVPATAPTAKRGSAIRGSASPRSSSPAAGRAVAATENNNNSSQPSLSRSSSRKAEHSPFRRNPMSQIDDNALALRTQLQVGSKNQEQYNNKLLLSNSRQSEGGPNKTNSHAHILHPQKSNQNVAQMHKTPDRNRTGAIEVSDRSNNIINNNRGGISNQLMGTRAAELRRKEEIEIKEEAVDVNENNLNSRKEVSGEESLIPQTLTRSRSARKSRDLDLLLNPSYASLFLEGIQNCNQHEAAAFTLPSCVSKACSILEAVADLNSCANSTLSSAFSDGGEADGTPNPYAKTSTAFNSRFEGKSLARKRASQFVESEVGMNGIDDLMEPSLHKYVTVRGMGSSETRPQESAGSNSCFFLDDGDHQYWVGAGSSSAAASSWEPNSADSTDRWMKEIDEVEQQQQAFSELGIACDNFEETEGGRRRLKNRANDNSLPSPAIKASTVGEKKREFDYQSHQHQTMSGNGNAKVEIRSFTRPVVAAGTAR